MAKRNLAAIDLGTNSCRLMIADAQGKELFATSIATKLGEGMYAKMRFTDAAVERGLNAFAEYAEIMKQYNVGKYRAIATASCRMAGNGADFVKKVEQNCGIKIDVIDGGEEALLNLKGAVLNAPKTAEYVVVYDLGGGSTEITLAKLKPELEIVHTVSVPWGARNSAEAFGLAEYNEANAQKLATETAGYVADFNKKSELEKYADKACLIATSSTPLRLVSMAKKWGEHNRNRADGVQITTKELDKQISEVWKMSVAEKENSPYIGKDRAAIFNAGCVIFKTIYDNLKFDNLTASLKSARHAIIEELVNNGKTDTFSKTCARTKDLNSSR